MSGWMDGWWMIGCLIIGGCCGGGLFVDIFYGWWLVWFKFDYIVGKIVIEWSVKIILFFF